MPEYLSAVPAYGRDYKSKKEVMAAWNEGKDFQIQPSGQLINLANFNSRKADGRPIQLNVRYKKLTQICVIK